MLEKQLKDYLEEQQEPFHLGTYLSERRYRAKNSTSPDEPCDCGKGGDRARSSTSNDGPDESCDCGLTMMLEAPRRSVKLVVSKLVKLHERQEEISSCGIKATEDKIVSETIDMIHQIAYTNWFCTSDNVSSTNSGKTIVDESCWD